MGWVLFQSIASRQAVPNLLLSHLEPPSIRLLASDDTPLTIEGGGGRFRFADAFTGDPSIDTHRSTTLSLLVSSLLAAEDHRFFEHRGVDGAGLGRAILTNIDRRSMVQGGSTLTQQVARTAFHSAIGSEDSLRRKAREAFVALRLERTLSKEEILEAWLTWVPLSPFEPGILSASQRLYSRPPWLLELPHLALLSGLAAAPSLWDPLRHPKEALERRNRVLDRMVELRFISPSQGKDAKLRGLELSPPPHPIASSHFLETIREITIDDDLNLEVVTTLNPLFQKAAWEAICVATWWAKAESEIPTLEGVALVSIDPRTGDLLAYAPHNNFQDMDFPKEGEEIPGGETDCLDAHLRPLGGGFDFGRATRSPGSAVKPFILAAGMEAGLLNPHDPVFDGPTSFWNEEDSSLYQPKNADGYLGLVGWTEALASSSNVVAVTWADQVGTRALTESWSQLGFEEEWGPWLSSALGTTPATLLEMVSGFATIAGDGIRHPPRWVLSIEREGSVQSLPLVQERVLLPETSRTLVSLLGQALPEGTGFRAVQCDVGLPSIAGPCLEDWMPPWVAGPGSPPVLFGKTGTSQANRDGWFIGCIPSLCTGIWMGTKEAGGGLVGGNLPALAFNLYMRRIAHLLDWVVFPPPPPSLSLGSLGLNERKESENILP